MTIWPYSITIKFYSEDTQKQTVEAQMVDSTCLLKYWIVNCQGRLKSGTVNQQCLEEDDPKSIIYFLYEVFRHVWLIKFESLQIVIFYRNCSSELSWSSERGVRKP